MLGLIIIAVIVSKQVRLWKTELIRSIIIETGNGSTRWTGLEPSDQVLQDEKHKIDLTLHLLGHDQLMCKPLNSKLRTDLC